MACHHPFNMDASALYKSKAYFLKICSCLFFCVYTAYFCRALAQHGLPVVRTTSGETLPRALNVFQGN